MKKVISTSGHFSMVGNSLAFIGNVTCLAEFHVMTGRSDDQYSIGEFQTLEDAEKCQQKHAECNSTYTEIVEEYREFKISGEHGKGDYDWNGHWEDGARR